MKGKSKMTKTQPQKGDKNIKIIEQLICESLVSLQNIYPQDDSKRKSNVYYTDAPLKPCRTCRSSEDSLKAMQGQRLVFPTTYDNKNDSEDSRCAKELRLSEQEARFAFTTILDSTKTPHLFQYAVEVPTIRIYRFKKGNAPRFAAHNEKNVRSASVDVCLFLGDKATPKKYYLEFKAHSVDKEDISKDFFKLIHDRSERDAPKASFFIHVFETLHVGKIDASRIVDRPKYNDNTKSTIVNIAKKYSKSLLEANLEANPEANSEKLGNPNPLYVYLYFLNKGSFQSFIENNKENDSLGGLCELLKTEINAHDKKPLSSKVELLSELDDLDYIKKDNNLTGFKITIPASSPTS